MEAIFKIARDNKMEEKVQSMTDETVRSMLIKLNVKIGRKSGQPRKNLLIGKLYEVRARI